MCKNTKKSLAALIALLATLALMACVPTVDPKELTGDEDIPYANYIIVKLAKNEASARSLDDDEARNTANFYELVVVELNGPPMQTIDGIKVGTGKPGADILSDRKPRGQGSLVVPVTLGKYYAIMFLEGWRSADGQKYVLLRAGYSAFNKTNGGNAIVAGANEYELTGTNGKTAVINVDGGGWGGTTPPATWPDPIPGAYKFSFKSNDPLVIYPDNNNKQNGQSFRLNEANKVLPVTIDIPKQGPVMDFNTLNEAAKLEITVGGFNTLYMGFKTLSTAATPNAADGIIAPISPDPKDALRVVGPDFSILPLVTKSGFVINNVFKSALNVNVDNAGKFVNEKGEKIATSVVVPPVVFDPDYTKVATDGTIKLQWKLHRYMFSSQGGDAYLKFSAPYRAFSGYGLTTPPVGIDKLTNWTIMNGLDNDLDYLHHTGGAVFVRIDGGSGVEGILGSVIVVYQD